MKFVPENTTSTYRAPRFGPLLSILLSFGLAACAGADRANPQSTESSSKGKPDFVEPSPGGKGDVYQRDSRRDLYRYRKGTLPHRLAQASALYTSRQNLIKRNDSYSLSASSLQDKLQMCPGARFTNQPAVNGCSATLIGEDIVLTSGHCLEVGSNYAEIETEATNCREMNVVFGFNYPNPPETAMKPFTEIPSRDVYRCTEVLDARHTADSVDYAILELDRPVESRTPASLLKPPAFSASDFVFQVGHPSGLPQKFDLGQIQRSDHPKGRGFMYVADLLGGNSGGGVFHFASGVLLGVPSIYSGQNYVVDEENQCRKIATCGRNTKCLHAPGAFDTPSILEQLPQHVRARVSTYRPSDCSLKYDTPRRYRPAYGGCISKDGGRIDDSCCPFSGD